MLKGLLDILNARGNATAATARLQAARADAATLAVQAAAGQAAMVLGDYPSAQETRLRRGRRPAGGSPNYHADTTTRANIRRDAQSMGRGNSDARSIAKRLADMLVGDGLVVKSTANDEAWASENTENFRRWMESKQPDRLGLRTGWQLLYGAMKVPVLEGDGLFVKMSDGTLQWIEAERIVNPGNAMDTSGPGQSTVGGVKIVDGRIVAYTVAEWNINSSGVVGTDTREIPAKNCIYVGNIADDALNQVRSTPMIQACVQALGLVEDIEANTAVSVAVATLFSVLIKTENPADTQAGLESALAQDLDQESSGPTSVRLEPGMVKHMKPGESVEMITPQQPGVNVMEFNRQMVAKASSDVGLARALSHLDLSGMTASNAKALVSIIGRTLEHQASQPVHITRELYVWRTGLRILSGEIAFTAGWDSVDVVAKGMPLPDLQAEIAASVAMIDNNLSTGERESERLGTGNFDAIVKRRGTEVKMEMDAGVMRVLKPGAVPGAGNAAASADAAAPPAAAG